MTQLKCSDCGRSFAYCEKGSKLKPKPLCPFCVILNQDCECSNVFCRNKFKRKDGWRDECWVCQAPVCHKCVKKTIIMGGIDFSFCEEHFNYDLKELKQDTEDLLLEESKWN